MQHGEGSWHSETVQALQYKAFLERLTTLSKTFAQREAMFRPDGTRVAVRSEPERIMCLELAKVYWLSASNGVRSCLPRGLAQHLIISSSVSVMPWTTAGFLLHLYTLHNTPLMGENAAAVDQSADATGPSGLSSSPSKGLVYFHQKQKQGKTHTHTKCMRMFSTLAR